MFIGDYMKQMRKLNALYAIFVFFVVISLGSIVMSEKFSFLMEDRIKSKVSNFINENYSNIIDEVNIKDTKYKNGKFITLVENKINKHLNFYIYYYNKKYDSTYKDDYINGNNFLKYISNIIENDVNKKTENKYIISINNNLDNFTDEVKKYILEEKDLLNLKIFDIHYNGKINISKSNIIKEINKVYNDVITNGISPKTYSFTFTDKNDLVLAIDIYNVSDEIINNSLDVVIENILNKNDKELEKYNIKYKYLN